MLSWKYQYNTQEIASSKYVVSVILELRRSEMKM